MTYFLIIYNILQIILYLGELINPAVYKMFLHVN